MPLVKIATQKALNAVERSCLSQAIQEGIENDLKAPPNDRFQIFTDHPSGLIYDKNYLGIERSEGIVFIQVFLKKGRSPEMKKCFYSTICKKLGSLGFRKEDVFITLTENDSIDWSFGNGEAQLAK